MKSIDLHGTPKVLTGTVVLDGIIAVCAMVLTMGAMARLIPIIRDQLVAPFDLISEGPHLQLMIAVRDGFNIYAPESHLDSPFRLVPYLPFYHAVIAMLFLFAAASSVFAVAPRRDWLGIPLAAFASFFLVRPIVGNTAYFRSDHAGVFFSVMAILTIARAPTRRGIILAAFFSAIALACKQALLGGILPALERHVEAAGIHVHRGDHGGRLARSIPSPRDDRIHSDTVFHVFRYFVGGANSRPVGSRRSQSLLCRTYSRRTPVAGLVKYAASSVGVVALDPCRYSDNVERVRHV